VIRVLRKVGFKEVRVTGSHRIFKRGDVIIPVPDHPGDLNPKYVFSVEDAAGNSRARERVDGLKKNQAASETRHTGVSALRASPIDRTADHWLTPAAMASRLCEPVRTNAKHKQSKNVSSDPKAGWAEC
jgi:predicted RNA binding protein YcfA (HicA-like mRNA interferase family)